MAVGAKTYRCPLCAGEVRADRDSCRGGCPLARRCRILCCPRCGYEFVEDSAIVSGIGRLFRRLRRIG